MIDVKVCYRQLSPADTMEVMRTRLLIFVVVTLFAAAIAFGQDAAESTAPAREAGEERPITIKKGDNVLPPRVVSAPNPKMPPNALWGTVVIQGVVGTDGKMHDPKVRRSLSPQNDASALDVILQWRFEPAKKDGKPVAVKIAVEVAFFPPK